MTYNVFSGTLNRAQSQPSCYYYYVPRRGAKCRDQLVMVALWNVADHYIFMRYFFFFFLA